MRIKSKSLFIKICFISLSLLCAFALGACRDSSALQQLLYSQDSEQLADANVQSMENQLDNENKIDNISPLQQTDDSEDLRDQKKDTPVWGEDANDERETDQVEFDANSTGDAKTEGSANVELKPKDYTGEKTDEDVISELDKGASVTPDNNVKQIVDAYGNTVELPAGIRSITAVGEMANMVYMLGGGDRLVASSEDLIDNALTLKVFGQRNLMDTELLWEGDGTTPLDADNWDRLLALNPDVCIEISGSETFTAEQIAYMNENGITYVVLPPLNTTDNISTAITVLADILGDQDDNNTLDAPALAATFKQFCADTVTELAERVDRFYFYKAGYIEFDNDKYKNGVVYVDEDDIENNENGKYSIYITDWDDEAQYRLYSSDRVTLRGEGVALCRSGYSKSPLSYCMSLGGVINTSATLQDLKTEFEWYIRPLSPSTRILAFNGGRGTDPFFDKEKLLRTSDNLPVSSSTAAKEICLGSEQFPAIIVPSQYVKDQILKDPLWKVYDKVTAKSGFVSDYGFLDEEGNVIKSNIIGDYEIYINPNGIGSWVDGSAESVLESVWIAMKFHNAYTEEEFTAIIKNFYSTFYRYTMTDEDIALLLSGIDDSSRYVKSGN